MAKHLQTFVSNLCLDWYLSAVSRNGTLMAGKLSLEDQGENKAGGLGCSMYVKKDERKGRNFSAQF